MRMLYFLMGVLDSIQWFAMLTFTLVLFRFRPMQFWRQSVLLAPTLKVITLILNAASLINLIGPVQLLVITLAFYGIYGIPLRAAIVMTFSGGITIFLVSAATLAGIAPLLSMKFSDAFLRTHPVLSPLHVCVLLIITFSAIWTLQRFRLGFSFAGRSASKLRFSELIVSEYSLPIAAAITALLACPPGIMHVNIWHFLVPVLAVCLAMLLLISCRRELEDI